MKDLSVVAHADKAEKFKKAYTVQFDSIKSGSACAEPALEDYSLVLVESFARGELAADWTNILSNPRTDFRFY